VALYLAHMAALGTRIMPQQFCYPASCHPHWMDLVPMTCYVQNHLLTAGDNTHLYQNEGPGSVILGSLLSGIIGSTRH